MNQEDEIFKVMQKTIGNREFIQKLMEGMDSFDYEKLETMLGTIISYYIATRDTNIYDTYQEIADRYDKIKSVPIDLAKYEYEKAQEEEIPDEKLSPEARLYRNVVANGFLTHSFNGYKKTRIEEYGFDYRKSSDPQAQKYIGEADEMRAMFGKLEGILGESRFIKGTVSNGARENQSDEVFFCSPGTKTFNYATKYSPERLYLGPLKQEKNQEEPIIVGESKESYFLRVVTQKLQKKDPPLNSIELEEALETAKKIINYYCTKPPSIAFVSIEKAKEIKVCHAEYIDENAKSLRDSINRNIRSTIEVELDFLDVFDPNYDTKKAELNKKYESENHSFESIYQIENFFSREHTAKENNNLGDLVTLSKYIPQDAIVGIIETIDIFEIKQMFARAKGIKEGTRIDYRTCEPIERAKAEVESNLGKQEVTTTIPNTTSQGIQEEKDNTDSQDIKEQTAPTEKITFIELIKQLKEQGLMQELLEYDKSIQELYKSYMGEVEPAKEETEELDFTEHVDNDLSEEKKKEKNPFLKVDINKIRTKSFFAIALMNMEGTSDKDRKVILEIIKNANIIKIIKRGLDYGVSNDELFSTAEIASSVEKRLEGFDKEDKELIKFALNYNNFPKDRLNCLINKLPENLRQRYADTMSLINEAGHLTFISSRYHRKDYYDKTPNTSFGSAKLLAEVAKEILGDKDKLISFLDEGKQIEQPEHGKDFNTEYIEESQKQNTDEQDITSIEMGQTGSIHLGNDETEIEPITDQLETDIIGEETIISGQPEKSEEEPEKIPVILKSTESWSKIKLTFQRLKSAAGKFKSSIRELLGLENDKTQKQNGDSEKGPEDDIMV